MNTYINQSKKGSLIIIVGLFIIATFGSCFKDRIDIDLNEQNKKVAVYAWITDLDESQFVKLHYTSNYLNAAIPTPIKNATITIANSSTEYTLTEKEDGTYYLPQDWTPEIGNNHTLVIDIENETYKAEAIMRSCPAIENMYINEDTDDNDSLFISVNFSFQETPGEGDGYFARDYKKGDARKDSLNNGSYLSDNFIDGLYIEDIEVTQESFEKGDTAVVEVFSIGEEASQFLQDIENETFRGSLFDAPPVNIRSNISNGAVGYFIIGGAQREHIIVE